MWTFSQILVVFGLILEVLSVIYAGKRWLPPTRSKEELKKRKYDEITGKTGGDILLKRQRDWYNNCTKKNKTEELVGERSKRINSQN